MSVLSSGLQGKNLEKFIIASGVGGNGKGLLNELALDFFGNYGCKMQNTVLLRPLKEGPNVEVAKLHKKRFVITQEPNSNYKINCSVMKELTGGNQINASMKYSNESKVVLNLTFIMECNKKPALDEIDPAVERRIHEVEFKSKFVDEDVYATLTEEEKKTTFVGNPYYKKQEFKDQYKQALFELLTQYYKTFQDNKHKLVVPDQVRKKTNDYLACSDNISEWINDVFEKTDNSKDIIKLKDIFQTFKDSEFYSNLSKSDKRKYNYKYFTEQMTTNLFLKKLVYQDSSKIYCLKNYKYKLEVIEADTNDDEDDNITTSTISTKPETFEPIKTNNNIIEINFNDCMADN